MEVVNSFTGDDALMDFRRWVLAPDTDAIKAAAKKGKGRGRKKGVAADDEGGFWCHSSPACIDMARLHQEKIWTRPDEVLSNLAADAKW